MNRRMGFVLVMGIAALGLFAPPSLRAQTCQDEEAMVADYKKTISDLAASVKKESLEEFERAYHRKNCLTKLTLSLGIVSGAADCFSKAAEDPATPKDQAAAHKAKSETYTKLKDKLSHYRDGLKSTEAGKDAKTLIEKIDLSG